jgi:general secretion pathway protein D
MKWKYFGIGIIVSCLLAFAAHFFQKKPDSKKTSVVAAVPKEKDLVEFVPLKYGLLPPKAQEQFIGKAVFVNDGVILRGQKKDIEDFKLVLSSVDTPPQEYLVDVLLLSIDTSDTTKTGLSILIDTLQKQDNQLILTLDPTGSASIRGSVAQILATLESGTSKVKIEGRTQLSVLSGGEASTITSGDRRAVIDQTSTNGLTTQTSYKYVDIGLRLTVDILPGSTAHAAALKIEQSADNVLGFSLIGKDEIPIISQRSLKTSVRVDVGETVVLGGLSQENITKRVSGLPFLRDIPFIRRIFTSVATEKTKSDLVVVLQPMVSRVNRKVFADKKYVDYRKLEVGF